MIKFEHLVALSKYKSFRKLRLIIFRNSNNIMWPLKCKITFHFYHDFRWFLWLHMMSVSSYNFVEKIIGYYSVYLQRQRNFRLYWTSGAIKNMAYCCQPTTTDNWQPTIINYYDKFYYAFNSNWCVTCSTVISGTEVFFRKKFFVYCCRCKHSDWNRMLMNLLFVPLAYWHIPFSSLSK